LPASAGTNDLLSSTSDPTTKLPTFTSDSLLSASTRFNIGLDEQAIVAMCPGATTWEAKRGVFVPERLLGPDQPFVMPRTSTECRTSHFNDGGGSDTFNYDVRILKAFWNGTTTSYSAPLLPTTPEYVNGDFITQTHPWWSGLARLGGFPVNENETPAYDTAYSNNASTAILLRGLDYNSSWTVQKFVSLEFIVAPNSVYRSLTTPGADYDKRALAAYYLIANEMPMCYPADHNDLGLLLPLIEDAVSALAPVIMPEVMKVAKSGIAWVGDKVAGVFAQPKRVPRPSPSQALAIKTARKPPDIFMAKPKAKPRSSAPRPPGRPHLRPKEAKRREALNRQPPPKVNASRQRKLGR